jgi:hypothetical protein
MTFSPRLLVLAGSLTLSAPAFAETGVVVELFTSQGCSSCPPADGIFDSLADMDGVIALSLHVDYWDYIGWVDSFGQNAFTLRQQDYAIAAGERTVYTPQFIIGGVDPVVGAEAMQVMDHIAAHADLPPVVSLNATRDGDSLHITAERQGEVMPLIVQLVHLLPEATVEITAGENMGHTIRYRNIVTDWQVLARWEGAAPLDLTKALQGDGPVVVILQEPGPGLIRAAFKLD